MNLWHNHNILNCCLSAVTETIKGKMMDILEKFMHPTDETAEQIKSALTSSAGDYEAVPVDQLIDSSMENQLTQVHKVTMKVKGFCHLLSILCV